VKYKEKKHFFTFISEMQPNFTIAAPHSVPWSENLTDLTDKY
jgi:hypothetical protein